MEWQVCTCNELVSFPCNKHAIEIDNWQLFWGPGNKYKYLAGKVEGKRIKTVAIVQASGRFALTSDQKWYKLLEPQKDWVDFQAKHKIPYNPADPLRICGKQ